MEDENSKNGLRDTWTLWEEAYYKKAGIATSLTQIDNSNVCLEEVEEDREEYFYSTYNQEANGNGNSDATFRNVIKEIKKSVPQENHIDLFDSTVSALQVLQKDDTKEEEKNKAIQVKTEKMTEYTQYLGLQPTLSTFECTNCNMLGNTDLTSGFHQCQCHRFPQESSQEATNTSELSSTNDSEVSFISGSKIMPSTGSKLPLTSNYELTLTPISQLLPSTSSESPLTKGFESLGTSSFELPIPESISQSSNFRITRKVYLCAACETYFENWNLFLHMREMHKRHICLFCLGMFGQAERLSHHLLKKHNVPEMTFHSVEEFYNTFKGSCYMICCSCDKIFSETDNFYAHVCSPLQNRESTSKICSLCRQVNSHMESCSLAPEKSDEADVLQYPLSSSKLYSVDSFVPIQTITGVRRHSKRTIKSSKLSDDVYLYTKLTNIRSKRIKVQNSSEIIEVNENINLNSPKHISIKGKKTEKDFNRESVTETVMEISKYTADSESDLDNCINSLSKNNSHKDLKKIESIICNYTKNIHNNKSETIKEVSTLVNESNTILDASQTPTKNYVMDIHDCKESKYVVESADPKNEDDVRLNKTIDELEKTEDFGTENHSLSGVQKNSNLHSETLVSSNPNSLINQSLFSPSHKLEENLTDSESSSKLLELENKTISNTPGTDRSLVIKICTKNNSILSISTPLSLGNSSIGNHDNFRESKENINCEASDNNVVVPKRCNEFGDQDFINKQDTDSDSDKLAVVDTSEDKNEICDVTIDSDVNKENKPDLILNSIVNRQEKIIEDHFIQQDEIKIESKIENIDGIVVAGEEIALTDLNVDDLLESTEIEDLLKRCIQAVSSTCVYCNHARHIAVNGKQLGLHMLAEHRFQPQHPAIIIHEEQFRTKLKKCINGLESYYFNLNSYNSKEGTYNTSSVRVYECFHCRFYSSAHKELYLHNRKMHQKPILICIMCKSTFYSYSELLCHLCPGVYAANINILYRCCLCSLTNLPSAFRLMVHLRKQHHACDVCLESTGNQQRLSNHVWKHKLHHLCYRCGIAYRNKPDITKHLFWKHGTESILCKRCLQKKWPHIYHFCIPPSAFVCEECGLSFSRAVALKVHKRTHTGDLPYTCPECSEKFISKKLLAKHEQSHKEPLALSQYIPTVNNVLTSSEEIHIDVCNMEIKENDAAKVSFDAIFKEPVKKVVDVYDLPPLNLSSDSDSEIDDGNLKKNKVNDKPTKVEGDFDTKLETLIIDSQIIIKPNTDVIVEVERNEEEKKQEEQIMDGIWDNFKSYTASLEKQETCNVVIESNTFRKQESDNEQENINPELLKVVLADHDYCIIYSDSLENQSPCKSPIKTYNIFQITQNSGLKLERTPSPDIAAMQSKESDLPKKKIKSSKKKKQNITSSSDSSSNSDSSSCSCGTNCSCSSSSSCSSSTSSTSSDSDSSVSESSPRKVNSNRGRQKKQREIVKTKNENEKVDVIENEQEILVEKERNEIETIKTMNSMASMQIVITESDLNTTETETDEDFYDEHPQQLANKLLAEKRNKLMLLASVAPGSTDSSVSTPTNNGIINTDVLMHPSVPFPISSTTVERTTSKKKIKTRKRKKGIRGRAQSSSKTTESIKLNIPKSIYQKKKFSLSPKSARKYSASVNSSVFKTNQVVISESSSVIETTQSIQGNESEIDTKRSSKRKRVPKRFYGDSSDEENYKQQMLKWRRVDMPMTIKSQLPSTSKNVNYKENLEQQHHQLLLQQQQQYSLIQQKQQLHQKQLLQPQQLEEADDENPNYENELVIAAPESDSDKRADDNSESSSSDNDIGIKRTNIHSLSETNIRYPQQHPSNAERSSNLYCYCQCPYDEVSEMIACDGDHCQIEWFHFECVGIMIPPKGKWYCPDCRRKLGISDDVEEFANG